MTQIVDRALGVESWAPMELRNIAVWNYWENAEWALEIGTGATRVQVRSLPFGWIWFIPIGPTTTSVGLVCPSEYYKRSGMTVEELYLKALDMQPQIKNLMEQATPKGPTQSCRDWSHLSERLVGDNWFLMGEAAGFADPILAAGMHLAHQSSRHVAYTILELERGEHDGWFLVLGHGLQHRAMQEVPGEAERQRGADCKQDLCRALVQLRETRHLQCTQHHERPEHERERHGVQLQDAGHHQGYQDQRGQYPLPEH